jgi:hypothetical protein
MEWAPASWSDIGHIAGALSFVLALWLAFRVRLAERPQLRIYKLERVAQPASLAARTFALIVAVDVVNASRNGNAIVKADVIVTTTDGHATHLQLVPPGPPSAGRKALYLIAGTWFEPPLELIPTTLPATVGGMSVLRLYLVGTADLDKMIGKDTTDELIKANAKGDLGGLLSYDVGLDIEDLHGNRLHAPTPPNRPFWKVWARG